MTVFDTDQFQYGFTANAGANGSVNVIGAVSDILIAASPFISCSIPGTNYRRSGIMISNACLSGTFITDGS